MIECVLATARKHGVRVARPAVIRDRMNVLVRLEPHPILARVQTISSEVRPARDVIDRAIRITRALSALGAPVAGPTLEISPGPHEEAGLIVSFWQALDHDPSRPLDASEAGSRLREIHDALRSLPELAPPRDTESELDRLVRLTSTTRYAALIRRAREALGPDGPGRHPAPTSQLLHGDAHLGNVLRTSDGPVWCDWEMAARGPREWDLATLVMHGSFPARYELFARQARDAVNGYAPGGVDPLLLGTALDRVSLLQLSWWVLLDQRRPGSVRREWIDDRAEWWERRLSICESNGFAPREFGLSKWAQASL